MTAHPTRQKTEPALVEFVVIISLMMSLTALSIDAMLPALAQIGAELGVQNPNERQLIVSVLFLGLSIGQLFFGPLSDKTGRKPAIFYGFALFILGALISAFSASFPIMLTGRLLQGLGVSAPRAVTLALVRDRFEGRAMARVMSFVSTVFILIPMIAPSLGQGILLFAGWRSIFIFLIVMSLGTLAWFGWRMPETLPKDKRAEFSLKRIVTAILEVVGIRSSLGYTLSAGLVSGAFIGYLNSSQQILQEQYQLGEMFPIYFGVIAFSIGLASFLNARLVMKYGMRFLVRWSLVIILALTCVRFWRCRVECRSPALVVPDGLSFADILLHRDPVWQPELPGNGAPRAFGRGGVGSGGIAFDADIHDIGHDHWAELQRHRPAGHRRAGHPGTVVNIRRTMGGCLEKRELDRGELKAGMT